MPCVFIGTLTIVICFVFCSNIIAAFHAACSKGVVDVIQLFLDYCGEELILKKGADGKGLNALQVATVNKRNLVVQTLLERYLVIILQ